MWMIFTILFTPRSLFNESIVKSKHNCWVCMDMKSTANDCVFALAAQRVETTRMYVLLGRWSPDCVYIHCCKLLVSFISVCRTFKIDDSFTSYRLSVSQKKQTIRQIKHDTKIHRRSLASHSHQNPCNLYDNWTVQLSTKNRRIPYLTTSIIIFPPSLE